MIWGSQKINPSQKKSAEALLRASSAAGDLKTLRSLLKAGVDPLAKAITAEWLEAIDHNGKKIRLDILPGDNAAMAACREGQVAILKELAKKPIWFDTDGAQIRSGTGEDYAMAAVSSKNPNANELLALLWELQPGMFLVEVGEGSDGALRQACKSGNAEALVFLSNKLSTYPQFNLGKVGETLSKVGRTGRNGLLWALSSGNEKAAEIVWSFIDKKQAFSLGEDGRGAWSCAAESGNFNMVLLCARWSDEGFGIGPHEISLKDRKGISAVGIAASIGDLSTARALWRCSLPEDKENLAKEAVDAAELASHTHIQEWFKTNAIKIQTSKDLENKDVPSALVKKNKNEDDSLKNKMAKDAILAREKLARIASKIARK